MIFEDRQFNKQVYRASSAHPTTNNYATVQSKTGAVSDPAMSRAQIARAEMEKLAQSQDRFSKYLTANFNAFGTGPFHNLVNLLQRSAILWLFISIGFHSIFHFFYSISIRFSIFLFDFDSIFHFFDWISIQFLHRPAILGKTLRSSKFIRVFSS